MFFLNKKHVANQMQPFTKSLLGKEMRLKSKALVSIEIKTWAQPDSLVSVANGCRKSVDFRA